MTSARATKAAVTSERAQSECENAESDGGEKKSRAAGDKPGMAKKAGPENQKSKADKKDVAVIRVSLRNKNISLEQFSLETPFTYSTGVPFGLKAGRMFPLGLDCSPSLFAVG